MSTREFHYQDGSSSKFWRITLSQSSYTVEFGRIGTAGQIQTKTFSDEATAQAASAKLIAEKLKKGYQEVTTVLPAATAGGPKSLSGLVSNLASAMISRLKPHPATQTLPSTTANAQPATFQPALAAPKTPAAVQPELAAQYHPALRVNLAPIDWFWANWRRITPHERPAPAAFDRADALRRIRRLSHSSYQWHWKWENVIPDVASPEEARFWLRVMRAANEQGAASSAREQITPVMLSERLATSDADQPITPEQAFAIVFRMHHTTKPVMLAPLAALFSPEAIVLGLLQFRYDVSSSSAYWQSQSLFHLLDGFRQYVLPYLSQRERERLSRLLTPYLKSAQWPTSTQYLGHPAFYLAALLGGHNVLLERLVQSWPDDRYMPSSSNPSYQLPEQIIFGLDDARVVEAQFRRLQLRLNQPNYIRAWLAHTEDRALDVVFTTIQASTEREAAVELTRSFALIAAPAAAPHMLALTQVSKAPQIASTWLDEHPSHTIAGLLPLADHRGAQTEAAIDTLRRLVRRGYQGLVEQALFTLPEASSDRLRRVIIEDAQPRLPKFDAEALPDWLVEALRVPVKKKATSPAWAQVADLPPLVIDQHLLNPEHVAQVVQVMQQGQSSAAHPLIQGLRQHADAAGLDRFVWALFERWLAEGAPSKENWAFFSLGLLGGDGVALKLAPLIRLWPGQSQHQRAVNGLTCLRMIGSDTALMQIHGIAQKVKFKGLQGRAIECMDQIAEERKLSRAQLEDRIVPDCDLDARGQRSFDYGSRQFRFVLGPEMKPMVRDPQGKLKPNLPPASGKDDAELAAQALAEWKLLKKQVSEVAKVQAERLEQAMVTGRRWPLNEFETLLVRHPLMTHLVRTLLWGVYDQSSVLTTIFRVTEDQSYADAADETVLLPAYAEIGLIHAFDLSADDRAVWGEIFSDYAIVQPFPQLGRAIQHLEADELTATEITRFNALSIPPAALVFGLDKLGWKRDLPADGGGFCGHFKPFHQANLTAVVQYDDGVAPGWIVDAGNQKIRYVAFVQGIRKAEYWPTHTDRLVLGQVAPIVVSEVLNDMLLIASKAT